MGPGSGGADGEADGSTAGRAGLGADGADVTGPDARGRPDTDASGLPESWIPDALSETDADPLWRMSKQPLCVGNLNPTSLSVWSNSNAIFVLAAQVTEQVIYINSGSGWSEYFRDEPANYSIGLRGFNGDGTLVEYGGYPCGIQFVRGQRAECAAAARVSSVAVVDETHAFAVERPNVLLFYDGTYWKQLGSPLDFGGGFASALWASSDTILTAGEGGRAYLFRSDSAQPVALPTPPDGDYISAWGFGPTDLWLGTAAGQLVHYDGATWRTEWTASEACGGIRGMWGTQGVLYFHTNNDVNEWKAGSVSPIVALPCDPTEAVKIAEIWGNSLSEVFIATLDTTVDNPCGNAKLTWFDGQNLRPL
jgi:hypothetical protein